MRRRALLALLLVAACSSPAKRIRANQAAFDAYAPRAQEAIRRGEVELGFTKEQVRMAMGEPDRRYRGADASGPREVWTYLEPRHIEPSGAFFHHHPYQPFSGWDGSYTVYVERARVVLKDGKVAAFESREQ